MVGTYWLKNHVGLSVTDEQLQTIPYPKTEMYLHITSKCVQTGGLVSTLAVAPALGWHRGFLHDRSKMQDLMSSCARNGTAIGLISGPFLAMAAMKYLEANNDMAYDLCYRLRSNPRQLRLDRYVMIGATAGFSAASYLAQDRFLGTVMGVNAGMILATVTNYILR